MSFSVVRGLIHSDFGPLNSNYLPKTSPFPVRALDNMAPGREDEKGVNEGGGGRKERFLGIKDRPVPSISTGIAVKQMTCHDWEFHR